MLHSLSPYLEARLIMGDSNIAFDQLSYKSGAGIPLLIRPHKQTFHIVLLLHSLGLVDIWRELNPSSGDFTHYSAPHKTYVRIDRIFLPTLDIHFAAQTYIRDISWLDHSLFLLKLNKAPFPSGPYP